MAGKVNRWIGIGRLTADPKQFGEGDGRVATFSVAIDRIKEGADFIDCRAFGKLGAAVMEHLKKGRLVLVQGRLEQRTWEKDGQKRSALGILAFDVQFLDGGGRPAAGESEGPPPEEEDW